jgi:hypothetical protein
MASIATAERHWVEQRPEMPAYFHDKFEEAARLPRSPGRSAPLLRFVGPGTPLIGRWAWTGADLHFRQLLAPAFLDQWERDSQTGAPARGRRRR